MPTGSPPTSASGFPVTGLCMPYGLTLVGDYIYSSSVVDDGGQQIWVLKINKNDGTYTVYPNKFGNDNTPPSTTDGSHLYMSHNLSISQLALTDLAYELDFTYEPWYVRNDDDGMGNYIDVYATPAGAAGIVIIGNYIYASHASDGENAGGVISRINKTDFTQDTSFGGSAQGYYNPGGLINPKGLASDGTYLYIANSGANSIVRINADGSAPTTIKTGLTGIRGLTFSGAYLYATLTNTILKIDIADPNNTITIVSAGLDNPLELAVSGGNIFVANSSNSQRANFPITLTGFIGQFSAGGGAPCFKQNTKILTYGGYIPIQDLKRGDLIKTIQDGFKPVSLIGKSHIVHNQEHPKKDQLYKCSQSKYPELFEDLIITGGHAILVDSFKEGEREQVIQFYGKLFSTGTKYRLPVCLDTRAASYEDEGEHTIYHIALEHDNIYSNYGIYANGLLVESCSKNYLNNLSKMIIY